MSIITPSNDELRLAHKRLEKVKLSPAAADLFIFGQCEANDLEQHEVYALDRSWVRYSHKFSSN